MMERCHKIDQYFEFTFNTQTVAGAATDADATPTYRVYEADGSDALVDSGNCALVDAANTAGFYRARAQCTTALGYEVGKHYEVRVAATVDGVAGAAVVGRFTILAPAIHDWLFGADGGNVDSTGGTLTLAKAVEALVAWIAGKCDYDPATGIASYYGQDGATVILSTPLLGGGDRGEPTIG